MLREHLHHLLPLNILKNRLNPGVQSPAGRVMVLGRRVERRLRNAKLLEQGSCDPSVRRLQGMRREARQGLQGGAQPEVRRNLDALKCEALGVAPRRREQRRAEVADGGGLGLWSVLQDGAQTAQLVHKGLHARLEPVGFAGQDGEVLRQGPKRPRKPVVLGGEGLGMFTGIRGRRGRKQSRSRGVRHVRLSRDP